MVACSHCSEKRLPSTLERMRVARSKLKRLRKQKRLLKRREQQVFDAGREEAEDLERLEALEHLNQAVALTNPEVPAEAAVVDWSGFWDFGVDDTGVAAGGSS
ncbi:hypothetical protein PTT_16903 [Pyrenophora teres f. teres 0-1]|uniref:Uncharacterized protein n=1 Tax=Pyrenophora teres f. teres (strain 0-1) TaxID=861557 RepID=E3S390_PYRTT|nr:hypothetical protein PTT_16903 [Pyrenophora teres f. teres 0-1]